MFKHGCVTFVTLTLSLMFATLCCAQPTAQDYPVKPIRMLVGFVPGGGADSVARIITPKLSEELGRSIVIENRPGAGSAIATERAIKSAPDGYTLIMLSSSAAILPALVKLPYDLERDMATVSMVATGPLVVVVHPSVPARNIKELIALTNAKPGVYRYASNGTGSPPHIASELLSSMAKIKLVHVPYKGGGDAVVATATGEVDLSFPTIPAAMPLLSSGKFRAIAVTGLKRSTALPDVATIDESGLRGYEFINWNGVGAPVGIPRAIVMKLNNAIAKVVNNSDMKQAFSQQGIEPQTGSPQQFADYIHKDIARNEMLIKVSGAKAE